MSSDKQHFDGFKGFESGLAHLFSSSIHLPVKFMMSLFLMQPGNVNSGSTLAPLPIHSPAKEIAEATGNSPSLNKPTLFCTSCRSRMLPGPSSSMSMSFDSV